jgi:hypothetical protein
MLENAPIYKVLILNPTKADLVSAVTYIKCGREC